VSCFVRGAATVPQSEHGDTSLACLLTPSLSQAFFSIPTHLTHTAAALAAASGYPPQPGMSMSMPGADGRGMGMGMGPPRGPQGMMASMAYYSPHDPSMMGLMPVRAPPLAC
jgi:hypothetical protein